MKLNYKTIYRMNNTIYNELLNKNSKIAVIGLGYVGLPLALNFAKKIKVVGFDINPERIALMQNNIDPSNELTKSAFENCDILFSSNSEDLQDVNFYIVAVPTPIDESNLPNLKPLISACNIVGNVLKKGDYVVFESTVYPGCTEEDCIPILENKSGLTFKDDFKVGYSPERINPGDEIHTLQNVVKVAAGCCPESLEIIASTYELVVDAGVHRAPSIKVAEAAKIIENTQRDLNIALMNELSIIFNKLNINTYDVLEAAGTKWNFLKFQPGLVGGHCIGVDPYYLTHKSQQVGYHSKVITSGRSINDSMGSYIAKETFKLIIANGNSLNKIKVLVMGATFKENVSDIRNSKVFDIVNELKSFMVDVDIIDPFANSNELMKEYGIALTETVKNNYDAIIVAVNHDEYTTMSEEHFKLLLKEEKPLLVDIKGVFKGKFNDLIYWSL